MKYRSLLILLSLFMLFSCSQELIDNSVDNGSEVMAHLSLVTLPMEVINPTNGTPTVIPTTTTRSTLASDIDEDAITDMWIVQFDNGGNFLKKQYFTTVTATTLDVPLVPNVTGATSNIYFLVNIGPALSYAANEAQFLKMGKSITSESDLFMVNGDNKKCIPMVGKLTEVTVPASGFINKISVNLRRMLTKVQISFTAAPDINIEKIRVCNVSTIMTYASPVTATTTPTSASTVQDFPLESVTDPTTGVYTYYIPDNQQGVGNNTLGTNERLKSGIANATYFELSGHTTGKQAGDQLIYSVYPGENNYNDYNIVRNTFYTVTTNLKDKSISDARVKYRERANCYMLTPGGTVEIPVGRANDTDLGFQLPDTRTGWTASLLWQTKAGLITVSNDSSNKGYFTVSAPSSTDNGNGLVVIRNASNTILWSWHIWVTDYNPNASAGQVVGASFTCMDRNLGAPGSGVTSHWFSNCAGLFYQWGRKDPFIYSVTASISASSPIDLFNAAGTKYVPETITEFATVAATNNSYVVGAGLNTANFDIAKTLSYIVKYPFMAINTVWAGSTTQGNEKVNSGSDSWGGEFQQQKTAFDPCPIGWRVPTCRLISSTAVSPFSTVFTRVPDTFNDYNSANVAILNDGLVFPMQGFADPDLKQIGAIGYVWTASANDITRGYEFIMSNISATPTASIQWSGKSAGANIRCVKNWN